MVMDVTELGSDASPGLRQVCGGGRGQPTAPGALRARQGRPDVDYQRDQDLEVRPAPATPQ